MTKKTNQTNSLIISPSVIIVLGIIVFVIALAYLVSLNKFNPGKDYCIVTSVPANICLNWITKQDKLLKDIEELKAWRYSLKEECVENKTTTFYNYSLITEIPSQDRKGFVNIIDLPNSTLDVPLHAGNIIFTSNYYNETTCTKKILVII